VILPSRLPTPPAPPKQCKTIAEIACADQNLTTLCAAVKQAGLATAFSTGTYTVFAPTDIAFKALPKATLDMYLANKQKLANLLLYHVVADQEIYEADLRCQRLLTMANGKDSRTFCSAVGPGVADNVYQKGRGNPQVPTKLPKIVMTDIAACNGLIHIVDNVMLP
jgi:transforming growth factor-beta-induced protein